VLRGVLSGVLRFRMLALGLAAALIAAGAISLPKMHNDVLPELGSGPVLEVQTEALGLSGQEVEQYITVPLENNLLDGVMGVWDVRSDSIAGLSRVDLYFEPGTTELHARQLVEERLANAFSLPNVAKPPLLIQPLSTSSRTLLIGLNSRTVNPLELSFLARWIVKPRLSAVPGVANVAIFGQQDRQIQVQVDPRRLQQQHVTLQQVIDTAGNSQLVSPLSYLEGSAPGTGGFLDGPNQRLDIRPVLPLGTPRDLATVPVADAPGKLPLGRVANVVLGHQPMIGDAITGGSSGLVLEVQRLPSASVVGVTKGVEQALSELRPALQGVSVDTSFFKPASYQTSVLHNLALGLIIAGALILAALAALLLELRALFVAGLSIALSLTAALLLLQWLGQTLNPLLVLGLLVASAVLVDDAVGGAYELVRAARNSPARTAKHVEPNGKRPLRATVMEVLPRMRGTLGYTTLMILLVAAPLFFASGLTARYLHPMLLALVLAVLASALVGLTFAPALGLLLLEGRPPRHHLGRKLGQKLTASYERLVRAVIKLPRAGLVVVGLAGVAGLVAFPFLHQPGPPRFKDRNLVVQWSGPAGAGLGEMNRVTGIAVRELRAIPGVADVGATLGRAVSGDQIVDPSSGQIYVALKASANYDRTVNAVKQIVLGTPGIDASVSTYESDRQAGVLAPATDRITVRVYGEDYGQMHAIASRLQQVMAKVVGLGPSRIELPAQEPNVQVTINDAAAHSAGVLPGDARRQASTLVSGLTVGNFFEDQAVFDVTVIGVPTVRHTVGNVGNLLIDTGSGGFVKLSRIANVSVAPDPIDIRHQALSRYVDVVAPVYSGTVASAQTQIDKAIDHMPMPLSYHAEVLGGTPEAATSHALFLTFVLAAAIGVLLLLQAAFSSWRLAAIVFATLPLSLSGGLLVALLIGQASSLGADAGLLAVLLFALRQGALLVAALRRRHAADRGEMRASLVVGTAAARVAPTLASIAVTAVAMIPFAALGDVAGNEIAHATADVILGGLLSTAIWTLLVLPALCLWLAPRLPEPVEESFEGIDPVGLTAPETGLVLKGSSDA
jgi:Cu/Ag efflux pump CusA